MPYLFSPSAGGFFNTEIHGDSIPSDAIRLSDGAYAALLAQQAGGRVIMADATGVRAVEPAPPPQGRRRTLTPLEFRNRFTETEKLRIHQAAHEAVQAGDPRLQVFLADLGSATEVDLDDPRTAAGLALLVTTGLLAPSRRDTILAG